MSESDSKTVEEQPDDESGIPQRNPMFYFEDDPMAVFLVEDQLFKVHRYYLCSGSEVFRHMFSSSTEQSRSDECDPIHLPDVTAKAFKTLLIHFYEQTHSKSKFLDSLEARLDLLSISHRFMFDDIFHYAARKLERSKTEIPVIDRIVLGDKYNLRTWLFSAFKELVEREQPLTEEEAQALGFKRVSQFCAAKAAAFKIKRDELASSLDVSKKRKVPSAPASKAEESQSNDVRFDNLITQIFFKPETTHR